MKKYFILLLSLVLLSLTYSCNSDKTHSDNKIDIIEEATTDSINNEDFADLENKLEKITEKDSVKKEN